MVDLRCLLCDNTRIVSRSGLSLHTASCHSKYFEPPRPCPACPLKESADDEGTPMISSLSEWCSHVALAHGGPQGAPSPPSSLKVSCLLCEKEVVNELTHYTRKHATAFDKPFPCPECNRQCVGEVPLIADRDDWELHCIIKHGRTTVVFGQQGSKLSRCLVCHRDFGKVADHFTKAHLSSLPFACRECERLEPPEKKVQIQDRDEWVLHCATVHADVSAALSARTATTQSKRKRKAEDDLAWEKKVKLSPDRGVSRQDKQKLQSVPTCFICAAPNLAGYGDKIQVTFKRWEDLWKHTNTAHRTDQLWPFSCPECERIGHEESLDQIADIGEWCAHVHEHHAPRALAPYRCIMGCETFDDTDLLREHLIKIHSLLWTVHEKFHCPGCTRLGLEGPLISNFAEWKHHIDSEHDPRLLPPM